MFQIFIIFQYSILSDSKLPEEVPRELCPAVRSHPLPRDVKIEARPPLQRIEGPHKDITQLQRWRNSCWHGRNGQHRRNSRHRRNGQHGQNSCWHRRFEGGEVGPGHPHENVISGNGVEVEET